MHEGVDTYDMLISMSHNGEATNNRDAAKCRKNFDAITEDTRKPSVKREVAKEDLPAGVRSRTIYGKKL